MGYTKRLLAVSTRRAVSDRERLGITERMETKGKRSGESFRNAKWREKKKALDLGRLLRYPSRSIRKLDRDQAID